MKNVSRLFVAASLAVWISSAVDAKTISVEIKSREIFAEGAAFGAAGTYERLTGVARGEVDPTDPRNTGIVNLDRAQRNANGNVEYDTDVFILRPVDAAKGNGAILYEVNNRGMKLLAGALMGAAPNPRNPLTGFNDPRAAEDIGDGLLLQLGYTLVWSGWDPNVSREQGRLAMNAPLALDHGAPLERIIRDEFLLSPFTMTGSGLRLSYDTTSLDSKNAMLTVRWREAEKGTVIPHEHWRFADRRTVELLPAGTKPLNGALYELHYRAKGPQVAGLGFAATRDLISYLRRAPDSPTPAIERTLAIGISQSARFLRGFVAEGFNRDTSGARVFDGVLLHVGGAGKVFLNAEFSQPFRTNTQYAEHFYPDFAFPYSTARLKDPAGGGEIGVLKGDDADPFFIEVNTSTEYWQKAASLTTTDPQGALDAALPPNSRTYFLAGMPHAPLALAQSDVVHPVNMFTPFYALRALLMKLDAWVAKSEAPPRNVVPRIDQGTLVPRSALRFPAIPAVTPPPAPNSAQRIANWIEPRVAAGPQPRVLVPQVDADGQDRGGIRLPEVAVPLGTALGWNLYKGEPRSGQMGGLVGSFIPFAKTKAERLAKKDPRPSLEERYAGKDDYVAKFRRAVDALVAQGLVRPEDADRYAAMAMKTKAFD